MFRRMNLERNRHMKPIYHSPELCTSYSNQFICEVIQWTSTICKILNKSLGEEGMQMWIIQGLCISERDRLRHKSHWFEADSNQLFSWSLRLFVFEVIHLGLLCPAFCSELNVLPFEATGGMFSEKTSGVETLSLSYLLAVDARAISITAFYLIYFYFLKFILIYFTFILFYTQGSININYCFW